MNTIALAFALFISTFAVVFALGLQSLNVNGGHQRAAFVTSFLIGASNLVLFKVMPGPTEPLLIAAYLLGGPFGIVASMRAHKRMRTWFAGIAVARATPGGAAHLSRYLAKGAKRKQWGIVALGLRVRDAVLLALIEREAPASRAAVEPIAAGQQRERFDERGMFIRIETVPASLALCKRMLDPEDLGHAVTDEVRALARCALRAGGAA